MRISRTMITLFVLAFVFGIWILVLKPILIIFWLLAVAFVWYVLYTEEKAYDEKSSGKIESIGGV